MIKIFIEIPLLFTEFEFQKCGQILCAHKPYFLMPGHIQYRECVQHSKCPVQTYDATTIDKQRC